MQTKLDAMCRLLLRHAGDGRSDVTVNPSPVPNLGFGVARRPTSPRSNVNEPMACLVLQGAKVAMIGGEVLRYDPAFSFIASLELPMSGRIVEASPAKPYVGVGLRLDRDAIADLMAEMPACREVRSSARADRIGFALMPVTDALLDAWAHFLALLDTPDDARMLAPLREREILYRLLQGPQGAQLRQIARDDSRLSRVRRAIAHIKQNYDAPIRVETLATIAGMSAPSFHRHFRAATAMSPLQYQKTLRLQAARRLLLANPEAGRAAYSVGYESVSQFSRDYSRMFGTPPSRDAEQMRGAL